MGLWTYFPTILGLPFTLQPNGRAEPPTGQAYPSNGSSSIWLHTHEYPSQKTLIFLVYLNYAPSEDMDISKGGGRNPASLTHLFNASLEAEYSLAALDGFCMRFRCKGKVEDSPTEVA